MSKLVVVALGGNALLRSNQKGTYQEQIANVTETCQALTDILKRGNRLIIGHGNGPQVGNVMLQHEAGLKTFDLPAMPMDFCVSETQGSIGYLVELGFKKVLAQEKIDRNVVTLITQVVVDKNDPMFQNPTKPVGPYYTQEEAEAFPAYPLTLFLPFAFREDRIFRSILQTNRVSSRQEAGSWKRWCIPSACSRSGSS